MTGVSVTSEVERDGVVGGDGAGESWSFTWTDDDGTAWTTYAYAVHMPDRFSDWAERTDDVNPHNWDVETFDMSADDNGPFDMPSLNGYATEEEADREARKLAEAYRRFALADAEV